MIFKRIRDGRESQHWYCKVEFQGRQYLRNTRYTAKADAERFERALRKALAGDREQALAALTESRLRAESPSTTLGQVVAAFRAAPGDWTPHTRRGYIGGLRALVETALGAMPSWESRPVSILNAELVYQFRAAIHREATGAGDARRAQLGRSGNTVLRSARALFSPALVEHYRREAQIVIPDLSEFRSAPGFRGVAKDDYRIPRDELISATLAALDASRDSHRDRFLAVWLALGFGLRKSEAAAVRAGWFIRIGGRVHLELAAVVQPGTPGRESDATKSGAIAPRIPVANGAWSKIEPLLAGLAPDAHVLATGGTDTYRGDVLFDEIALWMRDLGWETQKAFHEFRALAGCWVAMRDGLLVARDWLRHASVTTTERNYGRYIRTQVTDAAPTLSAPAALDTALDTTVAKRQTTPNDGGEALFGAVSDGAATPEVLDFPPAAESTPSGAIVGVRSSIG